MILRRKIVSLLLVTALCMGMVVNAHASEISETEKKAEELEQKKQEAEGEKQSLVDQLNAILAEMDETKAKIEAKEIEVREKQIVKQQVLDKIILIKPFFISDQKILDLEGCNLSHHVYVIAPAVGKKHILQLMLVEDLKELIPLHYLAVRRGFDKRDYLFFIVLLFCECACERLPVCIHHTEINPRDSLQSFNCILKYLIRYHILYPPIISICIIHNKKMAQMIRMHITSLYLNTFRQKNKEEITHFC